MSHMCLEAGYPHLCVLRRVVLCVPCLCLSQNYQWFLRGVGAVCIAGLW